MSDQLPIDEVLPELIAVLTRERHAVLQAPPGAGKTTRVPLALMDARLTASKIVMLEPRRLATRAAATRMAATLGEEVGKSVGYRMRGETNVSSQTRIEVVTEGILTRMIQSDPSLSGIGAVIFDEFHERSLNADLGLALTLDVRSALRDDLIVLVMSATLDAAPVAELLGDAPIITSDGHIFPVETHWLDRPSPKDQRFETGVADLIRRAIAETKGGVLAFLPGEAEIRRVASALDGLGGSIDILPLFGAMPFAKQQAVLRPSPGRRKLVLATSIAETSLTIPDVRVVVDGGLARRARFDPGSGMSRLVTERATRAETDQRRGRAGRVAPGWCYRHWTKGEDGALLAHPPAEIEVADLTGLALELADWGSKTLPFLTAPPETALAEARALLTELGALDGRGITDHGRKLARLPLHPRLGHMLSVAGKGAAMLAALLADRDPMRGAGSDLTIRLDALRETRKDPTLSRIRTETARLEKLAGKTTLYSAAEQAALAYPDRIALRRPGDDPRWLMSGGKGAKMDPADPLASQRLLVVTDTDGHPRDAMIRQAIPITESALRSVLCDRIDETEIVEWSRQSNRVEARVEERLGAIALTSRRSNDASEDEIATAMLDGVRDIGLSLSPAVERFRARVALAKNAGNELPAMDDQSLMDSLESWLLPHLSGVRSAAAWKAFDVLAALRAMLDWPQRILLDQIAPASFETPLGRTIPIDYSGDAPEIKLRLQELFGVTEHPTVADRPLRITLLSPAGRPVQTTMDLPGFWTTSYTDVRKDMRGRYPKHPWPEDPTMADPTLKARKRKT